jgi:vibriolysin
MADYGSDFALMDVEQINNESGSTCQMSTDVVDTYDMNHGTSTPFTFGCSQSNYKAINGAYSPLNDAHYFGGVLFDMYNDYVGEVPLLTKLKMRVHYSNNYENAFWDSAAMTFGDGQDTFHPLVSLDVVAHEVNHGLRNAMPVLFIFQRLGRLTNRSLIWLVKPLSIT